MSEDLREDVRSVTRDALEKGDGSWNALAQAGICALAAPEEYDGSGLGFAELAVVLHEVGHRAADLPVWDTLVCGLLSLRHADPEAQAELIPRIVSGDLLFSAALSEVGRALPVEPATTLREGRVHGTKVRVARREGLLLVSTDAGVAIVDPAGEGVTACETPASSGRDEVSYVFDGALALHVIDDPGLRDRALAGALAQGAGLLAGATALTAGYLDERTQFGRKLAEFQAVAVQIAQVYIDSRMLGLGAQEAVRRVAAVAAGETEQDPSDDLAIAAYAFCDRAPRTVTTCHHLHGGMGIDDTYPLHRYYSQVEDLTRLVGGVSAAMAAIPVSETAAKNAELTPEQRRYKQEARDYFEQLLSREDRLEIMRDRHGEAYHRTIKQMGSDGWMGVGWPVDYGGKGLGGIEQQIFANEASRADVHLPSVTLQTVGPTLQAFGTEKQKEMFLADILTGDVHFAIGYSEPDAGTDLASLRTTARRDGDHFIVNGQKMWTTGGHCADYIWLAVRTDPDAPKHKGISVLIVDTSDPGFSWTPIISMEGSHHVNATYYNDVRVPVDMLVGEENQGWRLITTQLNHERVMLGPAGRLEGLRDLVVRWAKSQRGALLERPDVHAALARVSAAMRLNELLNWQVAAGSSDPKAAVADASASKVFSSVEVQEHGRALLEVVTAYGDPADPETAYLIDYLDRTAKRNVVLTFGGGVNEVQSELIAMFGLGLPRVPR